MAKEESGQSSGGSQQGQGGNGNSQGQGTGGGQTQRPSVDTGGLQQKTSSEPSKETAHITKREQ